MPLSKRAQKYFEQVRREIGAGQKTSIEFGESTIPGSHTLELRHVDFPAPLGIVWFSFSGLKYLEILNIFTFTYVRRAGVARHLLNYLHRSYPERTLLTCDGTSDGLPLLKAYGFKKQVNGWEFPVETKRRSSK